MTARPSPTPKQAVAAARRAQRALTRARDAEVEATARYGAALAEAVDAGVSYYALAQVFGTSASRVREQVAKARAKATPPTRRGGLSADPPRRRSA